MSKTRSILIICALFIVLSACGDSGPSAEELMGTYMALTDTAFPTPNLTATSQASQEAQWQTETQSALDAQATAEAEIIHATETMSAIKAATSNARRTESAERAATQAAATSTAQASATNQAQPIANIVQDLYSSGYLTRTEGTYYRLPTFDQKWAQLRYYRWWYTDYSPTDFVIRVDASWESDSDTADWWSSGCGFVFRYKDNENFYRARLGLDGYVYMVRYVNGIRASMGTSYYGSVGKPNGSAELMLVAEDTTFRFFVNGVLVHTRQDMGIDRGRLAFTLSSGTNKGFGTRCLMENIDLWELDG